MNSKKRKGIETQYMIFIIGLILSAILLYSWNIAGVKITEKRMGDLKKITLTQLKNILFTMQYAPVKTQACVELKNCRQITIYADSIEILGYDNKYFKEGEYVSTSLVGDMDIYYENESCKAAGGVDCLIKLGSKGFLTTCGTSRKPLYLCFEKDIINSQESIIIERHIS